MSMAAYTLNGPDAVGGAGAATQAGSILPADASAT
jgi:hypothetical protein